MAINLLHEFLPKDLIKYKIQDYLAPTLKQSKEKFKACLKDIENHTNYMKFEARDKCWWFIREKRGRERGFRIPKKWLDRA